MEDEAGTSKDNESDLFFNIATEFRSDVIKESLKLRYRDPKTKITEEAVELMKEVMKALVVEAAVRSAKQAALENKSVVAINNVESMLPQLMLDFP